MERIMQLAEESSPLSYLLMVCLLMALWIFLNRFFTLYRYQMDVRTFMRGLQTGLRNQGGIEGARICGTHAPSPIVRVLHAVIIASMKSPAADLRGAAEDASRHESSGLERGMNLLALMGNIAPVIGLLGTFFQMMAFFEQIRQTGNFTPMASLLGPTKQALFLTILGLLISVTVHICHCLLAEMIDGLEHDMNGAASELLQFYDTYPEARQERTPSPESSPEPLSGEPGEPA